MTSLPEIAPNDHRRYMRYALDLARLHPATPPKFPVGAVLVDADKNKVLATGHYDEFPCDSDEPGSIHAEHYCFINVGNAHGVSSDSIAKVLPPRTVLYTTLEPCTESTIAGKKTCVERILQLGDAIKVVYVGIRKPDVVVSDSRGIERLEAGGIKVVFMDDDEELRAEILRVMVAGHGKE